MVKSRQLQVTQQQQKETTTISDATITSQRQHYTKKADTRKRTQNRDATITSQRQYYTITNRKNPNFALRPDEFNRTGSKSALELFYQGIRSQETKKTYTRRLKNVLCDILQNILHGTFEQRTEELVKKSRKDPQWTRDLLLCVSSKIKQRTKLPRHHIQYLKPSSVSNFFKPVKKLLEMNAIKIDWERIRVTFPEIDNTDNSRGWQKQEIQKMLDNTENPIDTALILVASSSGIRKGGFTLNWDDIMPVYYTDGKLTLDSTKASEIACAIIRIYSGTSSVYMGFITPEAFASIIHYKKTQWIPKMKREPQPQDPVFLSESSLRLGINGIYKRIKHTAQNSDLVQFLEKGDRRFEVPILCGFRRFWN